MRYLTRKGERYYQYALDQHHPTAKELKSLIRSVEGYPQKYAPRHITSRIKEIQQSFNAKNDYAYWVYTQLEGQISMQDYLLKYVLPTTDYKLYEAPLNPGTFVLKGKDMYSGSLQDVRQKLFDRLYNIWNEDKKTKGRQFPKVFTKFGNLTDNI